MSSPEEPISSAPAGTRMIYAVLPEDSASELADLMMRKASGDRPPALHLHSAGHLDELVLPEYATEAVQGMRIGVLAGGGAGLLAGLAAGGLGWVKGLGSGLGGALGLLGGVLVGALCASMSGHRRADARLRDAIAKVADHERLLTIDLAQPEQAEALWPLLVARDPRLLDTL